MQLFSVYVAFFSVVIYIQHPPKLPFYFNGLASGRAPPNPLILKSFLTQPLVYLDGVEGNNTHLAHLGDNRLGILKHNFIGILKLFQVKELL